MIKLNRRQFLKLTGVALVASALPLSLLATPKAPTGAWITCNCLDPGKYVVRFWWKVDMADPWVEYIYEVEVTESMPLKIMLPDNEGHIGGVQAHKSEVVNQLVEIDGARATNEIRYSNPITNGTFKTDRNWDRTDRNWDWVKGNGWKK